MDVACATCHHPDFAYADGRDLSLGPRAVGLGPEREDRSNGSIPIVDDMTDAEMEDIVAFLEALTDENFDRVIPRTVPSGLPPGGAIGR